MEMVNLFTLSLALTLILELPVGWLLGLRSRKYLALLVLVNLLTNPAAVLLAWLGLHQIPIEIGVVAVEALVYCSFAKTPGWKIAHPIALSVCANVFSWGSGVMIQGGWL